ncbi:helix-turn-helix domain-containing protein [Actinomadura sp. SCN-SB]|uniref:helix-turn-helix domain-containing protein n=1 Tax=Actinomadura sp. SCN-SB TaxID=3373092 RepID=UPI00375058EB
MASGNTVGDHIKDLRKTRRMSQKQLADAANISESYLKKFESGDRVPAQHHVIAIARALRVGTDRITGQPYYNGAEREEMVQAWIPDLRRVLWTYDNPDDLDAAPRPLPVLLSEAETVSKLRQDGQYVKYAPLLPQLLTELSHFALAAPEGEEREKAFWWLARGYRAANSLAHKLGHQDLSMTAIERVRWAATQSGDPYMDVVAGYLFLGALMRQGLWGPANNLMIRLETQTRSITDRWDNDSRGLLGAIVLKRAAAEARRGRIDATIRALEEAEEIAAQCGNVDLLTYETAFGPSNIKIHEVHAMLDLSDPASAVRVSDSFSPPETLPGERRSHHFIDLAAAQTQVNDRTGALISLKKSAEIAPAHTRFHPTARSTASVLARAERGEHGPAAEFARWMTGTVAT